MQGRDNLHKDGEVEKAKGADQVSGESMVEEQLATVGETSLSTSPYGNIRLLKQDFLGATVKEDLLGENQGVNMGTGGAARKEAKIKEGKSSGFKVNGVNRIAKIKEGKSSGIKDNGMNGIALKSTDNHRASNSKETKAQLTKWVPVGSKRKGVTKIKSKGKEN